MKRLLPCAVVLALAWAGAAACGDSGRARGSAAPVIDPGDAGDYQPGIDAGNFVDQVDHPYFPLTTGSRWVYEGDSDGEQERIEITVTGERRQIMGISAVVVRDVVHTDGELTEDTYDWFAQDRDGNVWYLGEDSKQYEDGKVSTTEGSWEFGVDGALPGIMMLAAPVAGDAYRQEFHAGDAEGMGKVERTKATQSVRSGGDYQDVVVIKEWSPLEAEVVELKYYAPGVGKIFEEDIAGGSARLELVEHTPGG